MAATAFLCLCNAGVEIEYANWYDSSSDSYAPYTLGNKCLLYDPNSNYQWIDRNCDDRNYYVCIRGKNFTLIVMNNKSAHFLP